MLEDQNPVAPRSRVPKVEYHAPPGFRFRSSAPKGSYSLPAYPPHLQTRRRDRLRDAQVGSKRSRFFETLAVRISTRGTDEHYKRILRTNPTACPLATNPCSSRNGEGRDGITDHYHASVAIEDRQDDVKVEVCARFFTNKIHVLPPWLALVGKLFVPPTAVKDWCRSCEIPCTTAMMIEHLTSKCYSTSSTSSSAGGTFGLLGMALSRTLSFDLPHHCTPRSTQIFACEEED